MKRIKDPIYGYIYIPKEIVKDIIDTAEFQRLRYIRQTSYLPVYPSSLHNRFTHSLGVYHLGNIAFEAVTKEYDKLDINACIDIERIKEIFTLSCLLHDIGHAPFSHSGEDFYLDTPDSLDTKLEELVDDEIFSREMKEYHNKKKNAAPHEIMSVILSLSQFGDTLKNSEERSLFARCITGYRYSNTNNDTKLSLYNAIISLLNSSTIDVDRLDYLIRDAFVMGYNSISIDYLRLLKGLLIVRDENGCMNLAFNKSALSVIENVIYAHDSEKKWIQNHPVILYETFLIKNIIREVNSFYYTSTGQNLFTLESLLPNKAMNDKKDIAELFNNIVASLSDKSMYFKEIDAINKYFDQRQLLLNVNLLCDDDIIFLSKIVDSRFCKELYNRNSRRSPIWKSESEYKVFLDGFVGDDAFLILQNQINTVVKFLNEESPTHCLDKESLEFCKGKMAEIESAGLDEQDCCDMKQRYELLLKWLKCFEKIHQDQNIDFDFVIIPATKFESSFNKEDLREMLVYFPASDKAYPLEKLINLFSSKEDSRRKYFYIYYKKNGNVQLDVEKIGREIAKLIL